VGVELAAQSEAVGFLIELGIAGIGDGLCLGGGGSVVGQAVFGIAVRAPAFGLAEGIVGDKGAACAAPATETAVKS
jgi:hypothetical protein